MRGERSERPKTILDRAIVRFADDLRIIALATLHDWELAQAVVDQTIVDVLRRKPNLRSLGKARGYLIRAVRNQALNRRESEARRRAVYVSMDEERPSFSSPLLSSPLLSSPLLVSQSVEADAIAVETEKRQEAALRKALESLTRKQREVWDRMGEGMKDREIAHELGIDVEAVVARRRRLIERLRESLDDAD